MKGKEVSKLFTEDTLIGIGVKEKIRQELLFIYVELEK